MGRSKNYRTIPVRKIRYVLVVRLGKGGFSLLPPLFLGADLGSTKGEKEEKQGKRYQGKRKRLRNKYAGDEGGNFYNIFTFRHQVAE